MSTASTAYFSLGYAEYGYSDDDLNIAAGDIIYSTDAVAVNTSDRGQLTLLAESNTLPSSDRAKRAYSKEAHTLPAGGALAIESYRKVLSVSNRGVHASPGTPLIDGYSSPYLGRSNPSLPAIVTISLPSAPLTQYNFTPTTLTVLHGNSAVASPIIGTHDVVTTYPYLLSNIHSVVANVPISIWALDQQYALEADGVQLYEWSLETSYDLIDVIPEWSHESQYSLLVYSLQEWSFEAEWTLGSAEWNLDGLYANAGAQILYDFELEINALRASLSLAPVSVRTAPVRDIAQQHSVHVRESGVMAHDDPIYPATWNTVEERIGIHISPALTGRENIVAISAPVPDGAVTGADIYTWWLGSPPHYANMIFQWPADADVQFLIGVEYFIPQLTSGGVLYEATAGSYFAVVTLVLINFVPEIELMPVEFSLSSNYSLQTAILERIDAQWDSRAYTLAQARHSAPYSLTVSVQHSAPYTYWVAASHIAPIHYTVHALHTALYTSTVDVNAQHGIDYSVEQYSRVPAQHIAGWSLSIEKTFTVEYGDSASVSSQLDTAYSDKELVYGAMATPYAEIQQVLVQLTTMYGDSTGILSSHRSSYDIRTELALQHAFSYGDQVVASMQHAAVYDLAENNFVAAQHRAFYAVLDSGATSISAGPSVLHNGFEIDCNSLVLEIDEGDAAWSATLRLLDPRQFANIHQGDTIEVSLQGVAYNLIVDTKNISRGNVVNIDMEITAVSPIVLLDYPRSPTITRVQTEAIYAHELVEDLLGLTVDWQVHDWVIPPYRFAVSDTSPLSAAKLVAEAVGGYISSNPDGSVYVQYLYPIPTNTYDLVDADHTLTDVEDNISYRGRSVVADGYNAFRVRDTSGYTSDTLEWEPDEGSTDQGTLRAYLLPWRPAVVAVSSTNASPVNLVSLGTETYTHMELVQIVNGSATLEKPAVAILDTRWVSDTLSDLHLEPRTRDVRAGLDTNYGYGLVEITYTVECLKYRVSGTIGTHAQFLIVDSGV